jgi:electron transport complex protein RnfA
MAELLLLALGASLVNHFAAMSLPGLRPAAGPRDRVEAAAAMGVAVLCVLPLASAMADIVARAILARFALGKLDTLVLLLLVATLATLADTLLEYARPLLHERLRAFVPLLATNCAVLGVGFVRIAQRPSFFASLGYGAIAAAVFALVLVLFTALDERVDGSDVPRAFRGAPITLVSAGLVALAFAGLGGLGAR